MTSAEKEYQDIFYLARCLIEEDYRHFINQTTNFYVNEAYKRYEAIKHCKPDRQMARLYQDVLEYRRKRGYTL